MSSALAKLSVLLLLLLSPGLSAQEGDCTGETYAQVIRDTDGRNVRLTAVIPYPGGSGDLLLGGTVGGDIWLLRSGRDGTERWRSRLPTTSESTELSTLNALVVDPEGLIAGVGSTYNGNAERGYLFRFDPVTRGLRYFRQPDLQSELTGIAVDGANYLLTGARRGQPEPIFASGFLQRVRRTDGLPVAAGQLYDYLGEEAFLDAKLLPNGDVLTVGNTTLLGGAGRIRSAHTLIAPDGSVRWSLAGPIPQAERGKLFAFDVEVSGSTATVLHWGNIGLITGGLNTTVETSRIDLASGEVSGSVSYDLTDFDGEQGIDLIPTPTGYLIFGYSLIGRRYPWLLSVATDGEVQWAKSYELPGNATLYTRANYGVYADEEGIVLLTTYTYPGGAQPHDGLLLRLEPDGSLRDGCLNVRTLNVTSTTNFPNNWVGVPLERAEANLNWSATAPLTGSPGLVFTDDCDRSCESCDERVFRSRAICRGDSLFVGGRFRAEPAVYVDTLPGPVPGCDSLLFTELLVSDGPSVTYAVDRQCGLARARVQLTVTGGQAPYAVGWPTTTDTGLSTELATGVYSVTVTDAPNCFPVVVEVIVPPVTGGSLDYVAEPPVCPGDSTGTIRLVPAGRGSVKLISSNGAFQSGPFQTDALTGLLPGTYGVVIRDSTGCEVFRQVDLPSPAPLDLAITGERVVQLGDEAVLTATSTGGQPLSDYEWLLSGSTDSTTCLDCPSLLIRPATSTPVTLTATTASGCSLADSLLLRVIEGAPRLYLPTAFSPNDDGVNDVWQPGLGPEIAAVTDLRVFNRWGNLVEELTTENASAGWDGGNYPPGLYLVTLVVRRIDGELIRTSGEVLLLR